jgi:hypothetical protein
MEQIDIKDLKIAELEKQKKEVLDYIEKTCIYDKHLCGFCRGLNTGQVKTLVLKLGGLDEFEKRDMERH